MDLSMWIEDHLMVLVTMSIIIPAWNTSPCRARTTWSALPVPRCQRPARVDTVDMWPRLHLLQDMVRVNNRCQNNEAWKEKISNSFSHLTMFHHRQRWARDYREWKIVDQSQELLINHHHKASLHMTAKFFQFALLLCMYGQFRNKCPAF